MKLLGRAAVEQRRGNGLADAHLEALLGDRKRATTALTTLVGAVLVARAVGSGAMSDEILAAARESVLALAPAE